MLTAKGETGLVTGASRGIGRGIALKLAEGGVKRIAFALFVPWYYGLW